MLTKQENLTIRWRLTTEKKLYRLKERECLTLSGMSWRIRVEDGSLCLTCPVLEGQGDLRGDRRGIAACIRVI